MWNRRHELAAIFELTADYADRIVAAMEDSKGRERAYWERLSGDRQSTLRAHRKTVETSRDAIAALRQAVAELKDA